MSSIEVSVCRICHYLVVKIETARLDRGSSMPPFSNKLQNQIIIIFNCTQLKVQYSYKIKNLYKTFVKRSLILLNLAAQSIRGVC